MSNNNLKVKLDPQVESSRVMKEARELRKLRFKDAVSFLNDVIVTYTVASTAVSTSNDEAILFFAKRTRSLMLSAIRTKKWYGKSRFGNIRLNVLNVLNKGEIPMSEHLDDVLLRSFTKPEADIVRKNWSANGLSDADMPTEVKS